MYLRVLFSVLVFFCLHGPSRASSTSLFKTTALRELEEHYLDAPLKAKDRTPSRNSDLGLWLSRVRPFNYCRALSKLSGTKYRWGDVSLAWQRRFRRFGYWVCYRDCGGGGDCLYKSIISSMRLGNTTVSALRTLVADQFVGINSTSILGSEARMIDEKGDITGFLAPTNGTHADSDSLLNSTRLFDGWKEDVFLERLSVLATTEIAGEWQDLWSPSEILNGDSFNGTDISTSQKKALLVHNILSMPGNTHWGSAFDVNYIEKIYSIKIVILWKNRGIFYPTLGSETRFRRVVLIYYDDLVGHFQVVGVKKMNSPLGSDMVSVFKRGKTPTSLKKMYKEDTNNDLS